MGEACEAVLLHGLRRRLGGRGVGSGRAGDRAFDGAAAVSGGSSSSSLTDEDEEQGDGATSSPPPGARVSSSSLSSLGSTESETMLQPGAGGPLFELSTMLDHLPALRTGLSKYYQGRSQSFTSLAEVSCVEDLAKKTTPYIRRRKSSRCYAAALAMKNRLSKTIAKRAPRGSPERLLPRARKPPAYQGKREVYRC